MKNTQISGSLWRRIQAIYDTYKKRAKEKHVEPVPIDNFKDLFTSHVRIITMQKSLGRIDPYALTRIDKVLFLYSGVRNDAVVINIWTEQEAEGLTGIPKRTNL